MGLSEHPRAWNDACMIALTKIIVVLLGDAWRSLVLLFRPNLSLIAENLFLRRQLSLYMERELKPHRIDAATRISLAFLSNLFDWRSALVVVRPETLIRWHRAGWRLLWRWKCRPGRPAIPLELRQLIRRLARQNPLWGEERIANELLLKLGLRVSPRTVRKYMPQRPPHCPRGDPRWATFLRNHAKAVIACDFFLAVTATFRLLYVFVVIHHHSRRIVPITRSQIAFAFGLCGGDLRTVSPSRLMDSSKCLAKMLSRSWSRYR